LIFYPFTDEHFSPCNPRLFISHLSSDNLVLIDRYFSTKYLAKYVSGLDENFKVKTKAGQKEDEIHIADNYGQSTKVTGSNMHQKALAKKKRQNAAFIGRPIGIPELINLMLGFPQIYTNATFIRIPTVPLEERPGFLKNFSLKHNTFMISYNPLHDQTTQQQESIGSSSNDFIGKIVRQHLQLPPDRQFTPMEEIIISDALSCPVTIDLITLFAIRPPELRFVLDVLY
jgi:hypothetical protein